MENYSQNPQSTRSDHTHIDVNQMENLHNPAQEPSTNSTASQNLTLLEKIMRVCILFVLAVFAAISLPFLCFAALAVSPLLLTSVLITRLLQFIKHDDDDDDYIKATQLKHFIRSTLCVDMVLILLEMGLIFFPISASIPSVKHYHLLDLPISNWIAIIYMSCGFYIFSYFLYRIIHFQLHNHLNSVVAEAVYEIIDCLIFLWAVWEVVSQVPTFKNLTLLGGSLAWEWVFAFLFLLIGYNLITLFTHVLVSNVLPEIFGGEKLEKPNCYSIHANAYYVIRTLCRQTIGKHLNEKYLMYYAKGVKTSIDFVLSALMLLLTWVFYFGFYLKLRNSEVGQVIWKFGIRSLVSLLTGAFLWLIRTCLLLAWKVHTVYDRLSCNILESGERLYFLAVIGINAKYYDIFKRKEDVDHNKQEKSNLKLIKKDLLQQVQQQAAKNSNDVAVDVVQRVAKYFLVAEKHLCEKAYTSNVIEKIKDFNSNQDGERKLRQLITNEEGNLETNNNPYQPQEETRQEADKNKSVSSLCCGLLSIMFCYCDSKKTKIVQCSSDGEGKNDWDYFDGLMNNDLDSRDEVDVQTWVRMAHRRCMILANTLSSAEQVAGCLNKIISVLILSSTFIMWLLLTQLATTKVLVLIVSPLLAVTFIFGDTCKAMFQGIIFVFVVHPFDVGDLCVIDEQMLKVKRVSIWKTTFLKVGRKDEVIYPNSVLSHKHIINHKADIDWNDRVELDVASVPKDKLKDLKADIERFLDGKKAKYAPRYNRVEVVIKENKIMIGIDFRHEVNLKNRTFLERLNEKSKLRSEFVLHMYSLQKKFEGITQTSVEGKPAQEAVKTNGNGNSINHGEEANDNANNYTEKLISKDFDEEANGVSEITEEAGNQT